MNQKLQQAMVAAQSGNSREAQVLLTQLLSEDPEEVQAWFLLSQLVDSEQKQLAYLNKVLELDPSHEKAAELLSRLEMREELEALAQLGDDSQEEPIGALSDWATEEDQESGLEATLFTHSPLDQEDLLTVPPELFTDEPPADGEPESSVTPATAGVGNRRKKRRARLNITLIGLVVITAVVFIALIYLIITAL